MLDFDIKPRNRVEVAALRLLQKAQSPFRDYDFAGDDWKVRSEFTKKFSWAIPNERALAVIKHYGPIVEIGAGTGLWAMMLANRGVDVVAYDVALPGSENKYHYEPKYLYFPIRLGGPEVLPTIHGRTLMLCWPPYDQPMALDALTAFSGGHVVFIGEPIGGCTGSDAFHNKLYDEFEKVQSVHIPQWYGINDYLAVWRRK